MYPFLSAVFHYWLTFTVMSATTAVAPTASASASAFTTAQTQMSGMPGSTALAGATVTMCASPAVPASGSVCTNTIGSALTADSNGSVTFTTTMLSDYTYSVVDASGNYVGTYLLRSRYLRPAITIQ